MSATIVWFYTRRDCSLCDTARAAIELAVRKHALEIEVRDVDIDQHATLRERFTNDVPVIMVGEVEVGRHRIDPDTFAQAIKSASVAAPAAESVTPAGPATEARTISRLAAETCEPCRGGVPPLDGESIRPLLEELGADWMVIDNHHLRREFSFPDFATALQFTNGVGVIAESQGHHPDIQLSWGKVIVTIWTHKVDGLTRADFVLAAKISELRAPGLSS